MNSETPYAFLLRRPSIRILDIRIHNIIVRSVCRVVIRNAPPILLVLREIHIEREVRRTQGGSPGRREIGALLCCRAYVKGAGIGLCDGTTGGGCVAGVVWVQGVGSAVLGTVVQSLWGEILGQHGFERGLWTERR